MANIEPRRSLRRDPLPFDAHHRRSDRRAAAPVNQTSRLDDGDGSRRGCRDLGVNRRRATSGGESERENHGGEHLHGPHHNVSQI
jgi:hypothetical protein